MLGILRREGQPRRLDPPTDPTTALDPAPPPPPAEPRLRHELVRRDRVRPPALAPATVDRVLAAAVLVGVELELAFVAPAGEWLVAALAGVLIAAPLLWRRRYPRLAFAGVLGAVALQSALVDLETFPVSDIAAVVCATYAIAAYADRGAAVAGLVLALAGTAAHSAVFYPDGVVAALLGGVAAPWTLGRVIRAHRGLTRQGREEAARAERERVREAAAAVTRERMRVARELHDAVAHNISVIALQAAGADGIVERDPSRAAEIAALIASVAREALVELERLSRALDAEPDEAPPGLASVDALAERTGAAGLQVELEVDGEPAPLPAGLDLAAYRIVQEALANAYKHAHAGRARVTVHYEPRAVELEVADDGRGPAPVTRTRNGAGHGLVGMRERAALYGGTLEAGAGPAGGFVVRARLPIYVSIRVLIADDQSLVRAGLRLVLEGHDDIEVVGEASNGHEAIFSAGRLKPDVVLMDIRMPELDGLAATRRITAEHPARVLVLTTYDLDEYVYDALQAGASGFLLKDTPPAQLVDGIRAVASGEALLAPTVTRRLIEEFSRIRPAREARPAALDELTPRELEVLKLLARGLSNAEIAEALVLGDTTIKTHVTHVLSKLNLRDRVQAVVLAYEVGLVTPGRGE